LILIGILLTLPQEEDVGMICSVMEACKSKQLGQGPPSCEPLEIPAAMVNT
jgi:hypothetical protein